MNSRRVWVAIACFVGLFLILDRVAARVCHNVTLKSTFRFSRLYSGQCRADVLILGNSRGVSLVHAPTVEKALPLSVENGSYNGMGLRTADAILWDYVERNPPPRLLVLEISNINVGQDLLKGLKVFEQDSPRLCAMLKKEYPEVYYAGEITELFRFNTEVFLRAIYYLRSDDHDAANRYMMEPRLAENYFADMDFIRTYDARKDAARPAEQLIRAEDEAALRSILACGRERGFEIRLVIAPYFAPHIQAFEEAFLSWKARLAEIAGPEVGLYDYSQALSGSERFADPLHINVDGSNALLLLMIEDGVFRVN